MTDASLASQLTVILSQAPIASPGFEVPEDDPLQEVLLSNGQFWSRRPSHYRTVPGIRGQCHYNAAKYWRSRRGKARFVSGFAFDTLSRSWKTHRWCIEGEGDGTVVIETVDTWPHYFGYVFNQEHADKLTRELLQDAPQKSW